MGMDLGEAVIDVVLDLRKMAVMLKAVRGQVVKELQRAGEMGKAAFAKGLRGIAKVAKWVALGVAGVTAAMAAGAGVALHASEQLNEAMANVASLGSEAAAHVSEWKGELQYLSVQMGKTTDDLAGGLYQVVSAFGAADDTMQVLAINAKAATAGLAETTDAINLTSAVTKAYGDTSAKAVQQVADLALKTVQLGQTTFPELASSIGRVTPLAASMGLSMQDLFAVMATATGVTGSAAEVSTQMRAALQALMAPTDATAKLIHALGYESGQAMLQSLGFGGAMAAIVEAAEKSGRPLQDYIGQVRGQVLALALANGLSEQYTEKLEAMRHAVGATDEAFRAQTQGIAGVSFRLKQLKQRAVVFLQKVGDAVAPFVEAALGLLVPVLDEVATRVETVLTAFNDMVTGSRSFAEIHDNLTAVFGDAMGSKIFGFLDGIRQLLNGLREGGLMGRRFRDALERVGGSGAVAVFDNIVAAVGTAREALVALWNTAVPFITGTVIPFVKEHGPAIAAAIGAIGAALAAAALVSTIAGIAAAVASLANPVTLVLALVGLLAAAWVEDFGGIRERTAAVVAGVMSWLADLRTKLGETWQAVRAFVGKHSKALAAVKRYWGSLKRLFGNLWGQVRPLVDALWQKVAGWFQENGPLIRDFLSTVGGAMAWLADVAGGVLFSALATVAGVVADRVVPMFGIVRPLLLSMVDTFLGLARMMMQIVTGDLSGAMATLKAVVTDALLAVGQAFLGLVDWVLGWFGSSWAEVAAAWANGWAVLKTIVITVLHNIATAAAGKWNEMKAMVTGKVRAIASTMKAKWEDIKTAAVEKWRALKDALGGALGDMVQAVADKAAAMYAKGVDFIQGLWDGIASKVDDLIAWLREKLGVVLDLVDAIWGIKSPSREMMKRGRYLMEGLRAGMEAVYARTDWGRYLRLEVEQGAPFERGLAALGRHLPVQTIFNQQRMSNEQIVINAPAGLDAEALVNFLYAQRVLRVTEMPG